MLCPNLQTSISIRGAVLKVEWFRRWLFLSDDVSARTASKKLGGGFHSLMSWTCKHFITNVESSSEFLGSASNCIFSLLCRIPLLLSIPFNYVFYVFYVYSSEPCSPGSAQPHNSIRNYRLDILAQISHDRAFGGSRSKNGQYVSFSGNSSAH